MMMKLTNACGMAYATFSMAENGRVVHENESMEQADGRSLDSAVSCLLIPILLREKKPEELTALPDS